MANGKIKADQIEHSTAGSLDTKYVVNGSSKAWANATPTATVNDSLNVSAGIDHGTGDYTLTVTNSFTSVNYAMTATCRGNTAGHIVTRNVARGTAGLLAVEIETDAGAAGDFAFDCSVHGDLA